ncbi:unnamed protein product [Paramecium pentaurelia]|uniref:Uncharacterized protein n=1 Tax=Paramecium pentaurelia TaxID=43138 RepID=A0A8S1YRA6_9CILI|nr:unnamed protein product [Paramecium pentaurelia]
MILIRNFNNKKNLSELIDFGNHLLYKAEQNLNLIRCLKNKKFNIEWLLKLSDARQIFTVSDNSKYIATWNQDTKEFFLENKRTENKQNKYQNLKITSISVMLQIQFSLFKDIKGLQKKYFLKILFEKYNSFNAIMQFMKIKLMLQQRQYLKECLIYKPSKQIICFLQISEFANFVIFQQVNQFLFDIIPRLRGAGYGTAKIPLDKVENSIYQLVKGLKYKIVYQQIKFRNFNINK